MQVQEVLHGGRVDTAEFGAYPRERDYAELIRRCRAHPNGFQHAFDRILANAVLPGRRDGLEMGEARCVVTVHSRVRGPDFLITGGIHGDEPAGVHAVLNLLGKFAAGEFRLNSGTLTVALGNEEALKADTRYVKHNLNRLFRDDLPDTAEYEVQRAAELKKLFRSAEYFLDLHSLTAESPPFIMCERHLLRQCKAVGLGHVVVGWGKLASSSTKGDTENYGLRFGAEGFTVESGSHRDPRSPHNAWVAALRFLAAHGQVKGLSLPPAAEEKVHFLQQVHNKDHSSFAFTKPFKNFDRVKQGEVIGRSDIGILTAPYDCTLVLPGPPHYKVGEDIVYIATDEERPQQR